MAAENTKGFVAVRIARWAYQAFKELLLAIQEHHRWIHSPRARLLEEWTVRMSVLLQYAAYLLFALLAYQLWTSFTYMLARSSSTGLLIATDSLDHRSSLFYVFAGAFLIPAGLFIVWFAVKWTYKLIESFAHRRFPRFMRLPFHPLVLCGVALTGLGYQKPVATLLVRAYVEAREVVMVARYPDAGKREQAQAGSPPPVTANAQTEKLIEELRKHYEDRNDQPPPEPLQLELDASRSKRTKVD